MEKNTIKLNENALRKMISESVRNILNELDFRTFLSAAEKETDPRRLSRFRHAAEKAYNRDFGTNSDGKEDGYAHGCEFGYGTDCFHTYSGNIKNGDIDKTYGQQHIAMHDGPKVDFGDSKRGEDAPHDYYDDPEFMFNRAHHTDTLSWKNSSREDRKNHEKGQRGEEAVRNYFNGKSKYLPPVKDKKGNWTGGYWS